MSKKTLAVCFILVGLILPACAQDMLLIQPGMAIGRVKLGMTQDQVVAVLGNAEKILPVPGKGQNPDAHVDEKTATNWILWWYKQKMTVIVRDGKVTNVITLDSAYHLPNGIGVDSRLSDVTAAFGAGVRREGQNGPDISYPSLGLHFLFLGEQVMGVEVQSPSAK